jgi:hypothetical protein
MIQTVELTSLSSNMLMALRAISLHLLALKLAIRLKLVQMQILNQVTHYLLQISQLVHSSTTLSFIQVKAVSLQELQVMLLSLWLKKAFTLFFVFHQVNLEMFL